MSRVPENLEHLFNEQEYDIYLAGGAPLYDSLVLLAGGMPPAAPPPAFPPPSGETPTEASVLALIPRIIAFIGGLGVPLPGWLAAAVGIGAAAIGAVGVEKMVNGGTQLVNVPGPGWLPLGGPGLKEPPAYMVVKEWRANNAQFYKLLDGRIAVYSRKKQTWKVFRPARHIVISRNPKVNNLLKADKKINALMEVIARRAGMVQKKRRVNKK